MKQFFVFTFLVFTSSSVFASDGATKTGLVTSLVPIRAIVDNGTVSSSVLISTEGQPFPTISQSGENSSPSGINTSSTRSSQFTGIASSRNAIASSMAASAGPPFAGFTYSTSNSSPTRQAQAANTNGNLSWNAKLVIAAGVPSGLLFLVGFAHFGWFIYRRTINRKEKPVPIYLTDQEDGNFKSLGSVESGGTENLESGGNEVMGELGTRANTAELLHPPTEIP